MRLTVGEAFAGGYLLKMALDFLQPLFNRLADRLARHHIKHRWWEQLQ